MKRLFFLLVIPMALGLGCKPSGLVGTYTNTSQGTLALSDRGEFELTTPNNPSGSMKGKWSEEGKDVVLQPETVNGMPISNFLAQLDKIQVQANQKAKFDEVRASLKKMVLRVNEDRKVITFSLGGQPIPLTKR